MFSFPPNYHRYPPTTCAVSCLTQSSIFNFPAHRTRLFFAFSKLAILQLGWRGELRGLGSLRIPESSLIFLAPASMFKAPRSLHLRGYLPPFSDIVQHSIFETRFRRMHTCHNDRPDILFLMLRADSAPNFHSSRRNSTKVSSSSIHGTARVKPSDTLLLFPNCFSLTPSEPSPPGSRSKEELCAFIISHSHQSACR